jgi:DNA-directed RNA polymerase specialized sigma24 family protein
MDSMDSFKTQTIRAVNKLEGLEGWVVVRTFVHGLSDRDVAGECGITSDEARALAMSGFMKVKDTVFSDIDEPGSTRPVTKGLPG